VLDTGYFKMVGMIVKMTLVLDEAMGI